VIQTPDKSTSHSELDPKDWNEFRSLAHRALDDAITYLETIGDRPVWQPVPREVKSALDHPLPVEPTSLEQVYEEFQELVLPYATGNIHPRFWGWVMGTGSPVGVLSEMLAATMNSNAAGYDQSTSLVEANTLDWLKQMMGFPSSASGVLVSGGTTANLIGLTVARHAADPSIREHGLTGARMTVYGSTETHSWAKRACELLGLGKESLRLIPVDDNFEIDLNALKTKVAEDREAGLRPFCVIGNAGTVNTGATDDLNSLADYCDAEGLWFHVDGAFGALANLSKPLRGQLRGMDRAHSLAFDLHKWGYLPYEIGCVLVRESGMHRDTFAMAPHYLASLDGGIASAPLAFADLGIQLSRGFRALKLWMTLKTQGVEAWGRAIQRNVDQARYLASKVLAEPELELLAPVPLNIVCFRYNRPGIVPNPVNQSILVRLQEEGIAVPSSTVIDGQFAIRVAICNHRSAQEDFDMLLESVLRFGRESAYME
jgi:aromatic-L-amino-acid/L-tryptophan decarboxylase